MFLVAVADDNGDIGIDERNELALVVSAVDQEGVVLLGAGGDVLIHNTA